MIIDGLNVYTVDYDVECVANDPDCVTGTSLRQVRWSSSTTDGVFVFGYSVDGGALVELSPPVKIANDEAQRDDFVETKSGGLSWKSTLLGVEECPIALNANWDECSVFEVTADANDDGEPEADAGYPVAGTYWMTKGNGTAALEIVTEAGQWQLSDIDCQPIEECDGTW